MPEHLGTHILLDLYECEQDLNNETVIKEIMIAAALEAKTTVLHSYSHKFSPQGVSCIVVIAESHLSIHTWPEFKQAQVDVFTCGNNALPQVATNCITTALKAKRTVAYQQYRGAIDRQTSNCKLFERIQARQV